MTEFWLKTQKDLPLTARSQISKSSLCKLRPLLLLPGSEDTGRRGALAGSSNSGKASKLFLTFYVKALASFSQCTQREPYNHESSSAERRNFSDFRMFSSCALWDIMLAGGRSDDKRLPWLGLM
jgi:hypothetical protein